MPPDPRGAPTPKALGYRMPAEWEPHRATWLSWPHNPETWPGIDLERIESVWAQMAAALSPGERVCICADGALHQRIHKTLSAHHVPETRVRLYDIATDDAWMRDHGPTFVLCAAEEVRERAAVDWEFNAWGGKYPPWDRDQLVAGRIASALGVMRFLPGKVLEGGSIEVDGVGTVLTTEQCLLNPNRNPGLSREEIEHCLQEFLNVGAVLWLCDGIVGDDTDGHIDDIARFVSEGTLVAAVEEDPADENYKPLQENLRRLRSFKDSRGRPLEVVQLPMPGPIVYQGMRLPASYANFYIANEVVLVPVFGHPNDQRALAVLEPLFPGRRLVPIRCEEVVAGLGALHCVTQQEPA